MLAKHQKNKTEGVYMTTSYKKRRNKKILALCLSSFMLMAAATSFAACGSGDDSSVDDSEVTTTETDTARIKNGSFEFFDDNNGKNLIITSPTGWSKSTGSSAQGSASSSKTASGIVDTSDDAWKDLTTSSGKAHATEAEAKANWESLTARDRLAFYDAWLDEDDDHKLADLSFYDEDKHDYNITIDDVPLDSEGNPLANPGTHYADGAEEKDKDTHILMLHNSYSDGKGTAQKYTASTTITVEPGTSAQFSVWVKTMDMTFNGTADEKGSQVNGLRGAYIGVTHTVGGNTLDQVQIKNIDTQAVNPDGDDNGWVQYHFYLKGCSYASSTFTMVLGLGQGGGTDKLEYVDGYAFFDDVECSIVSNETYDETVTELVSQNKLSRDDVVGIYTETDDRLFRADKEYKETFHYALDLHAQFDAYDLTASKLKTGLTEEKSGNTTYVSGVPQGGLPAGTELYGQINRLTADDVTGLYTIAELNSSTNKYAKKVMGNDFKEYPFGDTNSKVLMLLSADGAAYTSTLKDDAFTLAPDSYLMVSFWLKTSDMSGFTGASITVHETEGTNETSLSSLDTTSITTVDIDDLENDGETIEDIYDGWQQCFFFLENETESDKSFYLTFSYGPTTIVDKKNSDFYPGYAAFTNFETYEMTEKQFSYAATGTYAKSVSLTGEELSSADAGFDSAASIPENAIETGIADPKNYTGVYGGSGYVVAGGTNNAINDNEYAGLVNKKYAANYRKEMNESADKTNHWLYKLSMKAGVVIDDEDAWWEKIFGTSTQPLLIYNDQQQSYGYIGSSQTVSSSSYATVSIKVKVSAGTQANIYLVDTSKKKYDKTLSINTVAYTYWYDDSGNVCAKDPSDKDFNKKTDVAFYLREKDGLYEVNKKWSGYVSDMDGKYYANLSNYEKDEETGNLLLADGYHKYNYDSSKPKTEGNDGIAYYCKDGKYYAYRNYTTQVLDLKDVAGLTPRYTNVKADGTQGDAKNLLMTVEDTEGEWVTCTFYIHTGSAEKNYRLEVWSGTREGSESSQSAKDSYVIFDTVKPNSVDSSFSDLEKEAVEAIKKENGWTEKQFKEQYANVIYSTYSFFDSPSFLRYDSTLDADEIGNAYTSYAASTYSEGIPYLYYEDSKQSPNNPLYTMFVDYSYIDVTVTADSTDDGGDDDTDDETESDTNMWLFISSLVIAIALIVAVIGLAIQKIIKKAHLKKARAAASNIPGAARRRYAKKAIAADDKKKSEPVKKEEPKNTDDNDPYDD